MYYNTYINSLFPCKYNEMGHHFYDSQLKHGGTFQFSIINSKTGAIILYSIVIIMS